MFVAIVLLVGWLLLALIPAQIAADKGYSFGGYYLFGLFLFVPALIVAMVKEPVPRGPTPGTTRTCPFCMSSIPIRASVCPMCRRDITPAAGPGSRSQSGGRPAALDTSPLPGLESGDRRCHNPECAAFELRTNATTCPVCFKPITGTAGSAPRVAAAPLVAVGEEGICDNKHCQARGFKTTKAACPYCGVPVSPIAAG